MYLLFNSWTLVSYWGCSKLLTISLPTSNLEAPCFKSIDSLLHTGLTARDHCDITPDLRTSYCRSGNSSAPLFHLGTLNGDPGGLLLLILQSLRPSYLLSVDFKNCSVTVSNVPQDRNKWTNHTPFLCFSGKRNPHAWKIIICVVNSFNSFLKTKHFHGV